MTEQLYKQAIDYLDEHEIRMIGRAWEDEPQSVELECFTNAGEDMIFCLKEPSREKLQEYIEDFDINANVIGWWPNGQKAKGMGVPFSNIKEHYEDYEDYLAWLQEVCDGMPC